MATTTYNGIMTNSDYAPSTLVLSMNKPEWYEEIVRQHSNQFRDTIGLDFRKMGLEKPMQSDFGVLYLEGWVHDNFIVGAAGAAQSAVNTAQVIPVDPLSMNAGRMYPKVGHVVTYPTLANGAIVRGLIVAIDAAVPTVSVLPPDDGVTVLPAVVHNDVLVITDAGWGVGSTQPEPSKKNYEQINYWTQIVKDEIGIDGSQLTNDSYVKISEYGGQYTYWNVALADLDARMDRFEEGAMLLGSGLTYSPVGSVVGTSVRETKGMITWGNERGAPVELDPATFDITDFEAMQDYFRSEGDQSTNIFCYAGNVMGRAISNELLTQVTSAGATDISSTLSLQMGNNGVDKSDADARAVTMNFRQYSNFDGNFIVKPVGAFSDPKGLGASSVNAGASYNYDEKLIAFPMTNIKDPSSNMVYPNVALRYKEKNGYSRRRELVELTGATNGMHTTQLDVNMMGMKAEIAMQVFNPKLIYLMSHDA